MTPPRTFGTTVFGTAPFGGWVAATAGPGSAVMEMELSTGIWTDVSSDVLQRVGVHWERGIPGDGPVDVVAQPGVMTFAFNNAASNSGGIRGWYSPSGPNVRTGFGFGTRVRLKIQSGSTFWYHFLGTLKMILPTPGTTGTAEAHCTAVSWFDQLSETRDLRLALQESYRSDQGVSDVIGKVATTPANQSIDVGQDTYAFIFDDIGTNLSAIGVLQDICQSERGYLYERGDATDGETLRFENRLARATAMVQATFAEGELLYEGGINVPSDLSRLVNVVDVAAFPRSVGTSNVVLVSLDGEVEVRAGETQVFGADYKDPAQLAAFVGGKSLVVPVATTDYTANAVSGGGGADVTSDFAVTISPLGSRVIISATNNGAATGYLRGPGSADGMQVRGLMLARFSPVERHAENATSIAAYGLRPMGSVIEMPYQGNVQTAQDSADFVANLWGGVTNIPLQISPVTAIPNVLEKCVPLDVGDKIVTSETMTGVAATEVFIHSVSGDIRPDATIQLSYGLAPADTTAVLIWDDPVAGVWDTARWGFG